MRGRTVDHKLLDSAKSNKNDEFYTQFADIEREVEHYTRHFEGKTVYCNCDTPFESNFVRYFSINFKRLKLKKLISTCYNNTHFINEQLELFAEQEERNEAKEALKLEITSVYEGIENQFNLTELLKIKDNELSSLKGNGDFRSHECIQILEESDIVVTNPPFSLFREFVSQLEKYNKGFLIIGNVNAITYKNVFNMIKNNKAWLGINLGRGISGFIVPDKYDLYGTEVRIENGMRIISPNNCLWLTNLDTDERHEFINLTKEYKGHETEYPTYDNYDAININRTKDIPFDYIGAMGVPITFLHKYNPDQFEIIKFRKGNDEKDLSIEGKCPYFRILIKRKSNLTPE